MNREPTLGVRAVVAKCNTVTRALWDQGGTITAVNVGTDFNGRALHELTLDEPAPNMHTENRVWRVRSDQIHF